MSHAESVAVKVQRKLSRAMMLLDPEICIIDHDDPDDIFGCAMGVPVVSPSDPWLRHSGGIYEPAQTDPISIKLDGPVHSVALVSNGALKCSGTSIGQVVGYWNGVQVATVANSLTDPGDCGEDDVTFGVTGGLDANAVVDSLIIAGVDPWTFDVLGEPGGRALLNYTLTFAPGWPCGGPTADARDSIRAMYDSTVIFTGQPFKPACGDFVSNIATTHFTWAELSLHLIHVYNDTLIGVFTGAMRAGIDSVRDRYNAPLTLNSTYRDPRYNRDVAHSFAKNSQHLHGTAADIHTTALTWQAVHDSAKKILSATVLEPAQDSLCAVVCVHVDWR